MEAVSRKKRKKGIFDFFPVPRILRMPSVGVDVSDESLKFIELKGAAFGITLGRFGKYNVSPGVIKDGKVKNTNELALVLKRFKEQHGFNAVYASLPEQHAFVFQTFIPKTVRRKNIRSVIEFKLEENIPLSAAEVIFDYHLVDSGAERRGKTEVAKDKAEMKEDRTHKEKEEGETDAPLKSREESASFSGEHTATEGEAASQEEMYTVNVVAYRREIVEEYLQAFRDAEIRPLSFEIETQASAYAVIPRGDAGVYMIVDFGRSQAGLSIIDGGTLGFTATLNVGGDDLNRAIIKTFSVSSGEAERMKNERGFVHSEKNKDLFEALISTMTAFKDELRKHYIYWNTHESGVGRRRHIEKIILCGGNANLPGLPEYLTASIGIPVVRADVWVNVRSAPDFVPPINYRHSLEYATTIGLALMPLEL
jgi:Tfp pilus assembly PilM family ATPase